VLPQNQVDLSVLMAHLAHIWTRKGPAWRKFEALKSAGLGFRISC